MKIASVEPMLLSIPLARPAALHGQTIAAREYNLVRLRTDSGLEGWGYARGGRIVHDAIETALAPLLLGSDAMAIEALWDRMYRDTIMVGRKGAVLRGISALDIALWDMKGKVAGLPLWRLLGGSSGKVKAYVSAAYYRPGQTPDDIAAELCGCVERGFAAVKMRVGGLSLKEDVARVAAARKALGDDIDLMVDANYGYDDHNLGIRAGLIYQDLGVRWLEEPTRPDNLPGSARIAAELSMPVSAGESECTRFGFREIIAANAADILQPDVTVVGGISEWLKVAALASTHGFTIAPHYFWEVHAHLVAATPCAFTVEYFERSSDIVNFDDVLAEPFMAKDGMLHLSDESGIGWRFDEDAVRKFRVA